MSATASDQPPDGGTAKPHSNWWGDPISEERQHELDSLAAQQEMWAKQPKESRRDSLFKGVKLTGADVLWLALRALAGPAVDSREVAASRMIVLSEARALSSHVDISALHLEGASLIETHLEGAFLGRAHLEGADLGGAYFDDNSGLDDMTLGPGTLRDWLDHLLFRNHNAALGDIKWRGADLTTVPWEQIRRLGDERDARWRDGADRHRAVVRAYRQVATQLRAQGMAEDADRFAYRAQVRQRGVLLRAFQLPQYLFSWVLALLAGYGYRPARTLFWYLATIASFTFLYMQATHGWIPFGLPQPSKLAPLPWYEALILSVSSFHGRGFFQPLQSLGDPVAALAAIEAVIGLFIEISFIATFTQRYFGNK